MRAPRRPVHEVERGQLCVFGAPHELTKISRPGTSAGPHAIREATLMFDFYVRRMAAGELIDVERRHSLRYHPEAVVDAGDLVMSADVPLNSERITAATETIVERGATPVMLGGDHFVTYPAVTGVARARPGTLAYLHVDMHADLADDVPEFGRLSCGSPVRRLIEDGILDPQRVVIFGVETVLPRNEWEYARRSGVTVVSNATVLRDGVSAVLLPLLERALDGADALYVSIDIDVLARHYAPGTGNAVGITGLAPSDLLEVVGCLRKAPLVGYDLVEVSPAWDSSGRTAGIAATTLVELMRPHVFSEGPLPDTD